MSAMRYMLNKEHAKLPSKEGDPNGYCFGELSGHNVVIGLFPHGSQGVGAAAKVATHMKRTFPNAGLRLLVGIGGGVLSQKTDIRLGDVVISMPNGVHSGVVQYDLGKDRVVGFERKGFLEPPPVPWRNAVVEMRSTHRANPNNISKSISRMIERVPSLEPDYSRPAQDSDILFSPSTLHLSDKDDCQKCDQAGIIHRNVRPAESPTLHYGLIASGNRVEKNAETRDTISEDAGEALCFEMEAAGLMNDFHCVAICGIANYADSHKNDKWHGYAAAVAAGCAKELLTYMDKVVGTLSS